MKRLATIFIVFWFGLRAQAQVVTVTAAFDSPTLTVGAATTLRVFAQVDPANQALADQIFSWYVDVLNLAPTNARADFATLQKRFSDNNPRTSSLGKAEGINNQRGIFDTFLNTPGAGVTNRIELFNCSVTALATGTVAFAVSAGTTVTNLAYDFVVNPLADTDPLTGGIYDSARAALSVTPPVIDTTPINLQLSYAKLAGISSNRVTLSFNAAAGRNYFLEYMDKLTNAPSWQLLPGAPHNSGNFVDTNASPSRFYRVRAVTNSVVLHDVKLQITVAPLAGSSSKRVSISFNPIAGLNHFLESTDRLNPGAAWQPLPGSPQNSGSYLETNSVPSRFYRVRISP
ncbi:MAG: hypothetical protein ACYDH9_11800 [Limisphaerales bacterium]